jgi:nucleotide-binding universal stress UspA family protein
VFERVLVPLDASPLAECVLPHVVAVARTFDAQVTLLHVLERGETAGRSAPIDPLVWHIGKAEARAYLDDVAARLREAGVRLEIELLEGRAARTVVEFAASQDASLVILSSHGRSGLSGWNVSSVAQQIILRVRRSVMIVRAYQPAAEGLGGKLYHRVLVPLDSSQRAEWVLPAVSTLASVHGSHIVVAHAVPRLELPSREPLSPDEAHLAEQLDERNRREAAAYLEQLVQRLPPGVETRLFSAENVTVALHDLVDREQIDLVVLSAHGHSGATRFPYGSRATSFIVYGSTPLLIVQDLAPADVELTAAEVMAGESPGH